MFDLQTQGLQAASNPADRPQIVEIGDQKQRQDQAKADIYQHVFDHLRRDNLNVQETENIVFEGAEAAVARINLDGAPSSALCDRITTQNEDVLDLQVVTL